MANDSVQLRFNAPHGAFYSLAPLSPTSFRLLGDGRILLEIKPDGTVVGEIEDASEAAKVFVGAIRGQLAAMFGVPTPNVSGLSHTGVDRG